MNNTLSDFQTKILDFVIEQIRNNERRILIEMPVGSGKSSIIKAITEKLLHNRYPNSIGILLPNIGTTNHYIQILKGSLSTLQIRFDVNRRSILIHNANIFPDPEPDIYIVDEAFDAEVSDILKRTDVIVIGFYRQIHQVKRAFGKQKADYSATLSQPGDLSVANSPSTNPELQLNSILTKLAIPLESKGDLSKALMNLDVWVSDYLANENERKIQGNKTELLETIVSRKEALELFDKLLEDKQYFASIQKEEKEEKVWQDFFEKHKWIFGLNLNLYFLSSLDKKKYEQVVSGHTFNSAGKRVDGLLKSNGLMSAFHFCEIKTDTTAILHSGKAYRADSYSISSEFAGAIAQTQKTVFKAMYEIKSKQVIRDVDGYDTDEIVYNYLPHATIVIGSMNEFYKDDKLNEQRYASFELFRKSLLNIQVITFDELYARAKAIVGIAEQEF